MHTRGSLLWISGMALSAMLGGCAGQPQNSGPQISASDAHAMIEAAIPANTPDRSGWVADIYAAFNVLTISPTHENICAVTAVIAQESSFRVDPVIPNLGVIAWKEIDSRAEHVHVPHSIIRGVLSLKSPNGKTYAERIDAARTEKELSDVYEDFIDSVPLGETLFADKNPVHTRGPMQVNVAFAKEFSEAKPYPYPVNRSIVDELFTRRGSIYFGTAHLLDYRAPYDDYQYRFADYNAGQYSSRNAAFQSALTAATGIALDADGALLPHDKDSSTTGSTELAARAFGTRFNMSESAIHSDLSLGRQKSFESTALYQRVFAQAEKLTGTTLPRAKLPSIQLKGPKIQRKLTTAWYANRVDQRFMRCLAAR
jgi:Protein of unknown function (DUF1615)